MKGLLTVAAVLLASAACGGESATVVSSVPAGSGGATTPATSAPDPEPGSSDQPPPADPVEVETWFTRGESLWYSKSLVEKRPGVGSEAVNSLVAGPRAFLRAAGVSTSVPGGARLLGLDIENDI